MWFIGVSAFNGNRLAMKESSLTVCNRNGHRLIVEGRDNTFDILRVETARCVNASEMLRFMRGEDEAKAVRP